jgi:multiple sugar transport system ATP-binding protein
VVVQIGSPQDIYDRPADMHVAGFIGSPPMSFLRFKSSLAPGQTSVQLNGEAIRVPALRQGVVEGELALGVRPEHVRINDRGEMRGEVFSVEYMGTMQIVTIKAKHGQLKARIPSRQRVRVGEAVGLNFDSERLVVFDAVSGSALKSRLFEGSGGG